MEHGYTISHREMISQLAAPLYLVVLIILGTALPLWTVIRSEAGYSSYTALMIFLIYMNAVAILFVLFAVFFLRKRCVIKQHLKRHKIVQETANKSYENDEEAGNHQEEKAAISTENESTDDNQSTVKRSYPYTKEVSEEEYGALQDLWKEMTDGERCEGQTNVFVRLGLFLFGIAWLIFNILRLMAAFGMPGELRVCADPLMIAYTFLNSILIILHAHFIYGNTQVCFNAMPGIARFGLMHLIGFNLVSWLGMLVLETLETFHEYEHEQHNDHSVETAYHQANVSTTAAITTTTLGHTTNMPKLSSDPMFEYCDPTFVKISSYLFPFVIEFVLICAALLYHMYSRIGHIRHSTPDQGTKEVKIFDDPSNGSVENIAVKNNSTIKVCQGSRVAFVIGIGAALFALLIVVFFYLNGKKASDFLLYAYVSWELSSACGVIVICVVSFVTTRNFKLMSRHSVLDESLLTVGLFGFLNYHTFSVIAIITDMDLSEGYPNEATIAKHLLAVIMGLLQTLFTFRALRVKTVTPVDQEKMPGRGLIMLLLFLNLGMWMIDTAELKSIPFQVTMIHVYGFLPWALISHVTLPLSVFYHFHSAACLAEVWQHAYKHHVE